VLAARVAHVGTFLGLLAGSFVVGPALLGAKTFPPVSWVAFFLGATLLASALALSFTVAGYMVALRTVGARRFRSAVVYAQVAVVGGLYAALYLLPPLLERYGVPDWLEGAGAWCFLFPPAWFGGAFELVLGEVDALRIALAVLTVAAPTALLAGALRLARGRYLFGVTSSEEARRPARVRAARSSPAPRSAPDSTSPCTSRRASTASGCASGLRSRSCSCSAAAWSCARTRPGSPRRRSTCCSCSCPAS
jgi:hypothetical protein